MVGLPLSTRSSSGNCFFLPVILHDDAVVQPHERAVILGADAVRMIAAAVLFSTLSNTPV